MKHKRVTSLVRSTAGSHRFLQIQKALQYSFWTLLVCNVVRWKPKSYVAGCTVMQLLSHRGTLSYTLVTCFWHFVLLVFPTMLEIKVWAIWELNWILLPCGSELDKTNLEYIKDWKTGILKDWKTEILEAWRVGRLDEEKYWKTGKFEGWKIGKLEYWKILKAGWLKYWKTGRLKRLGSWKSTENEKPHLPDNQLFILIQFTTTLFNHFHILRFLLWNFAYISMLLRIKCMLGESKLGNW